MAKAFGVVSPKGTDAPLRFFWPIAFRGRYSGPKVIGSITTTNLLSVPSFFLSQFPPLATKNRSRVRGRKTRRSRKHSE